MGLLSVAIMVNGKSAHTVYHLLTGYEDTVHQHDHACDELTIEQQHHHCNYGDYLFSPFVPIDLWRVYLSSIATIEYYAVSSLSEYYTTIYAVHARGPPAF